MNKAQYKYNKSFTLGIFNFRKSGLGWQLYSENVNILTALFCKVRDDFSGGGMEDIEKIVWRA